MTEPTAFKQNGGFCTICDSNHSQTVDSEGNEICMECAKRLQQRQLEESKN
jgi:hypothetical protein